MIKGPTCSAEELMARAAAGDPALLADLFKCFRGDLLSFMQRRCGDAMDAEDAVQDTFINAAKYLKGYRGETAIRNWLYRLAGSACTKMRRGQKGDQARHQPLDETAFGVDIEAMLDARLSPVKKSLEALSETNRAVLMLRDGEELSTKEVAEVLELSEANVRTRLHRARKEVRQALV